MNGDRLPAVHDDPELDRPIWTALTTAHAALARGTGDARAYRRGVSPLAALRENTAGAFDDLAALLAPGELACLFDTGPIDVPPGWAVVKARYIDQMVCDRPPPPKDHEGVLPMGEADVPEMLALTAMTEPGPFMARTNLMGRYFGVRAADGTLAAMAGQRLCLDRLREVSAVCTHPAHRGQGHAKRLVEHVAGLIAAEGRTPFLHVKTENAAAKTLYERLGFRVRRQIWFTALRRPA